MVWVLPIAIENYLGWSSNFTFLSYIVALETFLLLSIFLNSVGLIAVILLDVYGY